MANRPTQLSRFFITLLTSALSLSFISGLGLWYIHEQREKLADLPKWTAFCQSLHGLLNPLLCIFFGFLTAHIVGGWRMRVNHRTGIALAISFALLIVTGAALYYSDHRHFYFTIHLLAGLLLPVLVASHWAGARRWVGRTTLPRAQERAKE